MLFNSLKKAALPKVGKAVLMTKSYSPELYLAGGLLLGIGATITLAKAHRNSVQRMP